jgi:hypothetical protein
MFLVRFSRLGHRMRRSCRRYDISLVPASQILGDRFQWGAHGILCRGFHLFGIVTVERMQLMSPLTIGPHNLLRIRACWHTLSNYEPAYVGKDLAPRQRSVLESVETCSVHCEIGTN